MKTHKELIPTTVDDFEERDVPDGYHYELQVLDNGIWQWVLVANSSDVPTYEFNEDNTSVPKYYFDGGVLKAQSTNKIIEEQQEKE